jgi:hypothetical protein
MPLSIMLGDGMLHQFWLHSYCLYFQDIEQKVLYLNNIGNIPVYIKYSTSKLM